MLSLLLVCLAHATHITTYEPDVMRTKAPFGGMESLVVDPKPFLEQLEPLKAPPGPGVERYANGPGGSPSVLVFTNPMSNWAWLTINGTKVGTINPFGTITMEGVKPGWYQLDLAEPTGWVRWTAVYVAPPPPPPAPPKPADTDGDGFADTADQCPEQPETFNKYSDTDGCPDEVPKALSRFAGSVKGINFETNKATILKSSEGILKEALKVLNQYPDLRVEIQGHTDNVGDDAANLKLSQDRAQAVLDWFVKHGIAAERLTAVGYGETKPVASNDAEDGRSQNRRVEFILSQPPPKPVPATPPAKTK